MQANNVHIPHHKKTTYNINPTKLIRSIFLLLIVFGLSLNVKADQKAKSILDKVSENSKKAASLTADFNFTMDNPEAGINETSEGTLIIQGDKYKLEAYGLEVLCDSETMWTIMPDAEEVSISDAESFDAGGINPAQIFTIYEQGFEYSYLGEFVSNNKKVHKIDLIPTNNEREFNRVIIEIDKGTNMIAGAVLYASDNNRYIIEITSLDTNKSYPQSTFIFDQSKNPEMTVIDMR
jgi:outer membrane lipoprotein-sorting protein